MADKPTSEPFFRVIFASTDDFLMLSATLASKATKEKVRAALDAAPPAIILETSPNSPSHPVWFVNQSGQRLVLALGTPVTFSRAITDRQLPRGLLARLGERRRAPR